MAMKLYEARLQKYNRGLTVTVLANIQSSCIVKEEVRLLDYTIFQHIQQSEAGNLMVQ